MKKAQVNLKNTQRIICVEGYSFRPANNKELIIWEFGYDSNFPKKSSTIERIQDILQYMGSSDDIYMMRLVYKYYNKNKKCVKKKCSQFFFIRGEIVSKTEAVNYFKGINENVATEISLLPGDKVFRIHYETQAISPKYNYDLLGKVA